ncbi:hypothetical protein Aperf_G00000043330 [Anoplocephala perfoliata]
MFSEGKEISVLLGDPKFKPEHQRLVKLTIDLPAFNAPRTLSTCKRRKRIAATNFCSDVIANADVSDVFRKWTCAEITAKNRNAIRVVIKKALGAPQVYFNKTELSIIMHMYIQLTGLELRDLLSEEMKAFLYGTLGITNSLSLDGLCRASAVMNLGSAAASNKQIPPIAFVRTLSIMLRGTVDDRAELAFHVFDMDSDGMLRKLLEMRRLLRDSFDITISAQDPEIDPDEPVRDAVNILCDKLNCTITSSISLQDFRAHCQREPWIVECLLPVIPEERINYVFQGLFNTHVFVPSIEHITESRSTSV